MGKNYKQNSTTIRSYTFIIHVYSCFNLITLLGIGRENEPLDIELLEELLQSVARCDRILSHPYSRSLVLIGRSGTGRHSSMKLLSVLHKARLMTPNPGKSYGRRQFANDLKSVRAF